MKNSIIIDCIVLAIMILLTLYIIVCAIRGYIYVEKGYSDSVFDKIMHDVETITFKKRGLFIPETYILYESDYNIVFHDRLRYDLLHTINFRFSKKFNKFGFVKLYDKSTLISGYVLIIYR